MVLKLKAPPPKKQEFETVKKTLDQLIFLGGNRVVCYFCGHEIPYSNGHKRSKWNNCPICKLVRFKIYFNKRGMIKNVSVRGPKVSGNGNRSHNYLQGAISK